MISIKKAIKIKSIEVQMIYKFIFLLISFLFSASTAFSVETNSTSAEVLSAKSFLEDIIVKRYTQGLSTLVEKQTFLVGAQLELIEVLPVEKKKEDKTLPVDMPFDLTVGQLDSEQIIKQYAPAEEEKVAITHFLSNKKIKGVFISVGLREDLGEDVKKNVETWVQNRLKNEFGNLGKSEVSFLKELPEKEKEEPPVVKKEWFDWLSQFQYLAGVALAALTFLLAVLFWRITTAKSNTTQNSTGDKSGSAIKLEGSLNGGSGAIGAGATAQDGSVKSTISADEEKKLIEESFILSQKINALTPKISQEINSLTRIWSLSGDEGKMKLVSYADAVGKELGKLPIPPEAVADIAKIFSRMSEVTVKQKKESLEKVYWDLMTTLNLGSSVLEQPFSYLNTLESSDLSHILMNENPKLKTLVSLYLPQDVRKKYLNDLTAEQKLEVLDNAANLNQIPSEELKNYDSGLRGQMSQDTVGGIVVLDMTLEKIAQSLTLVEQVQLLPQIKNEDLYKFKKRYPTSAFLEEWSDDKLKLILSRVSSDSILLYLRLKPQLSDRFINLSPSMTAEVLKDDLGRPDTSSLADKENALSQLNHLIEEAIQQKEVDLSEIFQKSSSSPIDNVVKIKSA